MNVFINQGANLEHVILDDYADNTYHIANIYAEQRKDSNFVSHNFSIGKKFARRDYHIELAEMGANCDLNGLYFASNEEHIDHHTTIEHMKNNCTSNEHYKGILGGKAVAVLMVEYTYILMPRKLMQYKIIKICYLVMMPLYILNQSWKYMLMM